MPPPRIALYVTGHGFGHAVRAAEVATQLLARGARVLLRTDAPAWLFPPGVELLPSPGWPVDVGVIQRDGLDMDVDATRTAWDEFGAEFDGRAKSEAAVLRSAGASVVLGDVPPLAFAVAAAAGIPSLGMANFGWDWIYAPWSGFASAIACIRRAYAQADRLFRLPLHSNEPDAFPAFRHIQDVPLVTRPARQTRVHLRESLGLATDACVVLLSFGGFDAAELDIAALKHLSHYVFVLTPPMSPTGVLPKNVRLLPREQTDYPSLVAASDAVVTKLGYGIVADCLAQHVPALYTDRGPFRESPILEQAIHAWGRAQHIPAPELLRGHLGPYLDLLLGNQRPWADVPTHGAQVIAEQTIAAAASFGSG